MYSRIHANTDDCYVGITIEQYSDDGETVALRPTLETDRLILRPFDLADSEVVQLLAGDRAIADTTSSVPHPYEDGAAEVWISKHQEMFEQGKELDLAIVRKRGGCLLGAISLMGISPGHQAELGYWIGKPHWNQGFCTEAARALLRYAFENMGLERVHACHFARNPASGHVMENIGMRREGCRRQHVKKWGIPEDIVLYGLLRREWEAGNRSTL